MAGIFVLVFDQSEIKGVFDVVVSDVVYLFTQCTYHCLTVGNLGRVDLISEFEYDLFIRPDTCNPRSSHAE